MQFLKKLRKRRAERKAEREAIRRSRREMSRAGESSDATDPLEEYRIDSEAPPNIGAISGFS